MSGLTEPHRLKVKAWPGIRRALLDTRCKLDSSTCRAGSGSAKRSGAAPEPCQPAGRQELVGRAGRQESHLADLRKRDVRLKSHINLEPDPAVRKLPGLQSASASVKSMIRRYGTKKSPLPMNWKVGSLRWVGAHGHQQIRDCLEEIQSARREPCLPGKWR